ncbi:hypothetical protein BH11VER1_BH11VER1_02900 [soil metagenome]
MKWTRWIEHPKLLAMLTLVFALVPVWLALVTYRDARQKDERVYATTTQVLADQLQNQFERHTYLPRELRNRARNLDDAALSKGQMMPDFPWKEKLRYLHALGYAEQVEGRIMVRWLSKGTEPPVGIGEDLMLVPGVAEALKAVPVNDPFATLGCILEHHQQLVMLMVPGMGQSKITRGYIVAWIDLDSMCRDESVPLIRDQVLDARPLDEKEATPNGARRSTIRDGTAQWSVGIARGARFSLQYGPPTPWLTFIAVGLSAMPLLALASLAGRSARLRVALTAEQEVVRQQRYFTQSVSHEFRTPLGVILSGAELLESYAEQLTAERRSEVLAEIKDNTRHMNEMIERVLLLGRIDSSKLSCEPHPVNLAAFCHDIARKVRTAGHERCSITVIAPEHRMMLDGSLLGSVLDNLLSNAIKYSAPDQQVTLEVTMDDENLFFTVRDEGIGIPAKDIPRVCDPFHRCDNVEEAPGTGLGLAIAQRCATLHGGRLTIQSEVGHGTTVTVSIPKVNVS